MENIDLNAPHRDASRDGSPERRGIPKRRNPGLYGTAFLVTVPSKRSMMQILAELCGHPRITGILIGIEPYPTDPTRHHYHMVLEYGRRVHLGFSQVAEVCGASADVRYLKDTAAVTAACVYSVKNSHGCVWPVSRESFVQRATPKQVKIDVWTAEQMAPMVDTHARPVGYHFVEHLQFFPVN